MHGKMLFFMSEFVWYPNQRIQAVYYILITTGVIESLCDYFQVILY